MTTAELTERLHEVELALRELRTTVDFLKDQAAGFAKLQEEFRDAVAALDKGNALLTQRLDDHVRRAEVWGQRWWALVPLLVGAVLTLCSGLVVALARK